MVWLLVTAIAAVVAVICLAMWRQWIAPWRDVEQLVRQIGRAEAPRSFIISGSASAQRVGVALEKIFLRDLELEKQIAKRESGVQAVFSAMQDGLLVVDSDLRFVLANDTFRRLFRLHETARGMPLLELVREPALDDLITEVLLQRQAKRTEFTLGSAQFEINAVPTRNEAGKVTGAVVLLHDITELKRADEMRRDFVANVSHELRTPLSILRGYIETILSDPKMPRGETARILEVMEEHSNRLGLLANDLLTLARLESGNSALQPREIDLIQFFDGILRDWRKKSAAMNLKLITDVDLNCPSVRADEPRLREVFDNLLDNAVKYSPEKGRILLGAQRRGGDVVLSVSDNGIGISREDLPRIFERFYRADKARSRELGGTGLGLAIVKHIAQLHGGRVEAESALGQGTTIRVVLPIVTET